MKKKKGFTLIELLAVIVILAIIALIAVPVIMNVLNKARMSAFKDTAYGIISAGELYFAEQQLELNGMGSDAEFTWPNNIGTLQVKGNVPNGTVLRVNTKGETALAMSNGSYCITKGYSNRDVAVTGEFTECNIPKQIKTFAQLTTTQHVCTSKGQICTPGETLFTINVNDSQSYNFYVISDDGNSVNLIMNDNLGEKVAWNSSGGVSQGPLTALEALKTRTANWTNLEEYSYTLEDTQGVYPAYSGELVQNVFTRLPRVSDVDIEGICSTDNDECAPWIYEGLDDYEAYWLSDVGDANSDWIWLINGWGNIRRDTDDPYAQLFIRPVITLTK